MLTIKNGQTTLYCHFAKIIKVPGTSFQYPAWSQNMLEIVVMPHTSI